MKSKIIPATLVGLGFLIGASALSALAAWTPPPSGSPPNCPDGYPGCDAPINVSGTYQTKDGPLRLNYLSTAVDDIGLRISGMIQIADGNQAAGKVLTSDASGIGTWQAISASGPTTGTIMGYGTGNYTYGGSPTNCTVVAAPLSCTGTVASCPTGWSLITAGSPFGSCAGSTCYQVYMCAKL